jgi:uncharacterized protein (TIGR03067 family)
MLRLFFSSLIAFAFLGFGIAEDKKDVPKELQPLQGKWKLLKLVIGGVDTPIERFDHLVFDGDKMTMENKGEANDNIATAKADVTKSPAKIDLVLKKAIFNLGIFKIENDSLTLCIFECDGNEKYRPTKFESPKDSKCVLIELEKVK